MFNSDLKERLHDVSVAQRAGFEHLWARIFAMEQDFRLLLKALNMEVRKEEEFKVPRHIRPIPQPETMACCSMPAPAKRRKKSKGKR